MSITYDNAINLLRENPAAYLTRESLLALVREVTLDAATGQTQGQVTILYSGELSSTIHSSDVISAIVTNGDDARVDDRARIRTWNALHALNLTNCDAAVSPTHWQRSRHPEIFQPKIGVQHEGINTELLTPDPTASVTTPGGKVLKAGDPVITYVARNLEPYRGFHIFMRALGRIQEAHPACHALIVGGDEVSYGTRPKGAKNWREHLLSQVKLDPARTHFLGRVPYAQYLRVLQVSAAHVYLSYPFVLSWSLLEAMGCGAPVVASNTAPVREVIRDGQNGRLVEFFDDRAVANAALEILASRNAQVPMRKQARADVQRYNLAAGLAGYDRTIGWRVDEPADDDASPLAASSIELNARERELLDLLSVGHSTEQIAAMRHRSPATVRNQLSALYQKLGVARRTEAVAKGMALQRGGIESVTPGEES